MPQDESDNCVGLEIEWPDSDCERECVEQLIGIGQLSRETGVSQAKLRKWTQQGQIAAHRREGEHTMYPQNQAKRDVREILKNSNCKKKEDPT